MPHLPAYLHVHSCRGYVHGGDERNKQPRGRSTFLLRRMHAETLEKVANHWSGSSLRKSFEVKQELLKWSFRNKKWSHGACQNGSTFVGSSATNATSHFICVLEQRPIWPLTFTLQENVPRYTIRSYLPTCKKSE